MTSQLWKQIIIRENKLYRLQPSQCPESYNRDHLAILALTRMIKQSKKKEANEIRDSENFH